jgi:prolyl 4-hydroxylase
MNTAVTPEVEKWITANALAGRSVGVMLREMTTVGWPEAVAIDALQSTLCDNPAPPPAETVPAAIAMPEPDPERWSPLFLDGGDRRVRILLAMRQPRIVLLGGLLSGDECDALIEAAKTRMDRSQVIDGRTGGQQLHPDRTSEGMFFKPGESDIILRIEKRIAALVNWPVENGEGLQVLRYGPGAEYKPHYDYFIPDEPGTTTILERGGQRLASVIMYLNNPKAGGCTVFPDVQLEVMPKRGNAVFFSYPRPQPSTQTLHGGAPVIAGEKWIATKWLRESRFR